LTSKEEKNLRDSSTDLPCNPIRNFSERKKIKTIQVINSNLPKKED
jgi:hypothetical protein